MKKMLLMLFVMISIVSFSSCSEDETLSFPEFPRELTMYVGQTYDTRYVSDKWFTSDSYFVDVSNSGVITAKHVGRADIDCIESHNNHYIASIDVTVLPTITLYEEPFKWGQFYGASRNSVIDKFGKNYYEIDDAPAIAYKTGNSEAPIMMFYFENGYDLTSISVLVKSNYKDELLEHLKQRYNYLGFIDGKYCYIYGTLDRHGVSVFAYPYSSSYYVASYII